MTSRMSQASTFDVRGEPLDLALADAPGLGRPERIALPPLDDLAPSTVKRVRSLGQKVGGSPTSANVRTPSWQQATKPRFRQTSAGW